MFFRLIYLAMMLFLLLPCSTQSAEVDWLEEVTHAPQEIPPMELGYFSPLLEDSSGKPIETLQQWLLKREQLRRDWYEFLGPMPTEKPSNEFDVLKQDHEAGCLRQLIQYEAEPGQLVQAYLLSPHDTDLDKLPGLVALHQTTNDSIEEIAGLKGNPQQQIGPKLAKRGFIVICPRNYLWQDTKDLNHAVEIFKKRHPQTLGMHKMLYDAMRAVDLLENLPSVDKNRLGSVGHSLGGKEAFYLAAFDDRIQATVASEFGIGFKYTNWHAPWYLGQGFTEEGFQLNHHQLVAMMVPKPFLLVAGESGSGPGSVADGERSWPYLLAAQPIFDFYQQPVRHGLYNHRQGHTISDTTFEKMADWLGTYLAK